MVTCVGVCGGMGGMHEHIHPCKALLNICLTVEEVSEEVKPEEVSGLAPEFLEKPRYQTVDEGETVTFRGTVEATPQLEVRHFSLSCQTEGSSFCLAPPFSVEQFPEYPGTAEVSILEIGSIIVKKLKKIQKSGIHINELDIYALLTFLSCLDPVDT